MDKDLFIDKGLKYVSYPNVRMYPGAIVSHKHEMYILDMGAWSLFI